MKLFYALLVSFLLGCYPTQRANGPKMIGYEYKELINSNNHHEDPLPDLSSCEYMKEVFDDMRGKKYAVLNDTIICNSFNDEKTVLVSLYSDYLETKLIFQISPDVCIGNYQEILFKFRNGKRHQQYDNMEGYGVNCEGFYYVMIEDIDTDLIGSLIEKVRIYHDQGYTEIAIKENDAYTIQNSIACVMNNYRNEKAGYKQMINN